MARTHSPAGSSGAQPLAVQSHGAGRGRARGRGTSARPEHHPPPRETGVRRQHPGARRRHGGLVEERVRPRRPQRQHPLDRRPQRGRDQGARSAPRPRSPRSRSGGARNVRSGFGRRCHGVHPEALQRAGRVPDLDDRGAPAGAGRRGPAGRRCRRPPGPPSGRGRCPGSVRSEVAELGAQAVAVRLEQQDDARRSGGPADRRRGARARFPSRVAEPRRGEDDPTGRAGSRTKSQPEQPQERSRARGGQVRRGRAHGRGPAAATSWRWTSSTWPVRSDPMRRSVAPRDVVGAQHPDGVLVREGPCGASACRSAPG